MNKIGIDRVIELNTTIEENTKYFYVILSDFVSIEIVSTGKIINTDCFSILTNLKLEIKEIKIITSTSEMIDEPITSSDFVNKNKIKIHSKLEAEELVRALEKRLKVELLEKRLTN